MNVTLLRQVYRMYKIKKKSYIWYKKDKSRSEEEIKLGLARVKR